MRDQFVDAARRYVGARWRHQGRRPWAMDCIGLIVLACADIGRTLPDRRGYGRDPQADGLRQALRAEFGVPGYYVHGGIAAICWPGASECSHVGVMFEHDGEWWLLHGYSAVGCVVEHRIDDAWADLIAEVYDPWRS